MARITPDLEEKLAKLGPELLEQFEADCADIFSANAGARVLEVLCRLSHPLKTARREGPENTFAELGIKEVITLLWRRVGSKHQPPPTNNNHENET